MLETAMTLRSLGLPEDLVMELDHDALKEVIDKSVQQQKAETANQLALAALASQGTDKSIKKAIKDLGGEAAKPKKTGRDFIKEFAGSGGIEMK